MKSLIIPSFKISPKAFLVIVLLAAASAIGFFVGYASGGAGLSASNNAYLAAPLPNDCTYYIYNDSSNGNVAAIPCQSGLGGATTYGTSNNLGSCAGTNFYCVISSAISAIQASQSQAQGGGTLYIAAGFYRLANKQNLVISLPTSGSGAPYGLVSGLNIVGAGRFTTYIVGNYAGMLINFTGGAINSAQGIGTVSGLTIQNLNTTAAASNFATNAGMGGIGVDFVRQFTMTNVAIAGPCAGLQENLVPSPSCAAPPIGSVGLDLNQQSTDQNIITGITVADFASGIRLGGDHIQIDSADVRYTDFAGINFAYHGFDITFTNLHCFNLGGSCIYYTLSSSDPIATFQGITHIEGNDTVQTSWPQFVSAIQLNGTTSAAFMTFTGSIYVSAGAVGGNSTYQFLRAPTSAYIFLSYSDFPAIYISIATIFEMRWSNGHNFFTTTSAVQEVFFNPQPACGINSPAFINQSTGTLSYCASLAPVATGNKMLTTQFTFSGYVTGSGNETFNFPIAYNSSPTIYDPDNCRAISAVTTAHVSLIGGAATKTCIVYVLGVPEN